MSIVGIIAEFNPFHNGHAYIINKAKELSGADHCLIAMSGDFVQRGEPAVFPKHLRAEMALRSGADLILELPVSASTASAEIFAYRGVEMLAKAGATYLCFGCESYDEALFSLVTECLIKEPFIYKERIKAELKKGISFPKARERALCEALNQTAGDYSDACNPCLISDKKIHALLSSPNNILALEYMKAIFKLKEQGFSMTAIPVKRLGSSYHDQALPEDQQFPSATALRNVILKNSDSSLDRKAIQQWAIPEAGINILQEAFGVRGPVSVDDFSLLLKAKLLSSSVSDLTAYLDLSADLAHKIKKYENDFLSISQFCLLLKSADLTYSRISRALIHILLNIKKEDAAIPIDFAHVLGFRKDHTDLLKSIKEEGGLTLVTKWNIQTDVASQMIFSSNLYESVITDKYKHPFIHELKKETRRI